MGLALPLRAFPEGCTLRFSRASPGAVTLANRRASSPDLSPLSPVRPVSRGLASRWRPEGCRRSSSATRRLPLMRQASSPLGFLPFSVLTRGSDSRRAYLTWLRSALRFFQPRSAFLPPWPSRPCFMPLALLGFCPPEPSLDVRPWRLSTPAPLLPLPPGAGRARCGKPCAAWPFPIGRLQGFPPPASPFRRSAILLAGRRRCSPGLFLSKGLP
jgi:hypothetical protein